MENWCNERVMVLRAVMGLTIPAQHPMQPPGATIPCSSDAVEELVSSPHPQPCLAWQGFPILPLCQILWTVF